MRVVNASDYQGLDDEQNRLRGSPRDLGCMSIAAATFTERAFQPSQSPAIRMSAMPNMINDDNSGAGMHLVDNSIISDPNSIIPN